MKLPKARSILFFAGVSVFGAGALARCFVDIAPLASPDAADTGGVETTSLTDAADDATDASDDGCPKITRVQLKSVTDAITKSAQVTLDVTAGDLLVAMLGAQLPGVFAISDSANNVWVMPTGADNLACVTDAAPTATRTRMAHATAAATVANDIVTFTTGGAAGDDLALIVGEYTTSTALGYAGSQTGVADGSASNVVTTAPLGTTACTSLIVAFLADEKPSFDIWTPFSGFQTISKSNTWAYVIAEDLSAGPGATTPGATHTTSDKCWAATAAAFSPQ